ncbi:recombinase family protein, partial [Candidatus Sumerlaeota bacterium]|nr:recombinase family protein [Candidatus Sumerlaeota bacterium]
PLFGQMMKLLRDGKAQGVIIHKIDRSARNLKDWSDLGELIDKGIEVHFANESLDLLSRGGRLSADIQAVVAADFIRNLKEETKKGIRGRLKQGLYPLPAPLGYLDSGPGKPKAIDPVRGPLVRKAFDLYATGRYSLRALVGELYAQGLRNRGGGRAGTNRFSYILNNPFYLGVIRMKDGKTYDGIHTPLIERRLFDRVQALLRGKAQRSAVKHTFVFARLIHCEACGFGLVGERQKGRVYYRCHTSSCPMKGIREDQIDAAFRRLFASLNFSEEEKAYFTKHLLFMRENHVEEREKEKAALALQIAQTKERLERLMDAYVDRGLDRDLFEERKTSLLLERKDLEGRLARMDADPVSSAERLAQFLELAGSLSLSYEMANDEEKREIIKIATSNRTAGSKNLSVEPSFPFSELAKRDLALSGSPQRDVPRTWDQLIQKLAAMASLLPRLLHKEATTPDQTFLPIPQIPDRGISPNVTLRLS